MDEPSRSPVPATPPSDRRAAESMPGQAADVSTLRLAAVDIGSNSVRLVVAQTLPGGQFKILDEERDTPRLAKTLGSTGRIAPAAIDDTLDALRRFQKIARGRGVERLQVIATCAVREASNGHELCDRAREELGVEVEVITAEREAELAFLSVRRSFDISDTNVAVADLGGGSMEVVFASRGHVEAIFPTRLGVVRVSELVSVRNASNDEEGNRIGQAEGDRIDKDKEGASLLKAIKRQLRDELPAPPFVPQVLIGCGGTFTSIASMLMAGESGESKSHWGYTVSRAEVRHLYDRLQSMTLKQRRGYPGLNSDRADIIVAGLAIVDRLMRRLKVNSLRIHDGGVRDGLLRSMVEQQLEVTTSPEVRESAVTRFAASCGVESPHARHVAELAGQLFDQLHDRLQLDPLDREILVAAARLQDVGHLISYEKHHHHSYHLILHSQLPGFRRRDLEILANVARYHRGGHPKRKHDNYRRLNSSDQLRVRGLASLLRVAAGLDRGHAQEVDRVRARWTPKQLVLEIHAIGDVEVDLWAAQQRGHMLEKSLGMPLLVRTEPAAPIG